MRSSKTLWDQLDNRQIIRDMLAPTDYEITETENSEEALSTGLIAVAGLIGTPAFAADIVPDSKVIQRAMIQTSFSTNFPFGGCFSSCSSAAEACDRGKILST
jgi:hypothetical protein